MSKMGFTEMQKRAIFEEGKNILVSAGAGSGKTAVLTERIIEKLKKGISLDELIILTFTNAAAFEMKERVKQKLRKEIQNGNKNLGKEIQKIDTSLICTFDSFALFLVKKYYYLLDLESSIQIGDGVIIENQKRKIIDDIFEEKYEEKDPLFLKWIDTFSVKDDQKLKNVVLSFEKKIETLLHKEQYLENYIKNYYKNDHLEELTSQYEKILFTYIKEIEKNVISISYLAEDKTGRKLYEDLFSILSPLFKSKQYDEIKYAFPNHIPSFPRQKEFLKREDLYTHYFVIKENISSIKKYLVYENRKEIKEEIDSTKDTVSVLIDLLKRLDSKLFLFKRKYNLFEFSDIMNLAISLLENHKEIREKYKKEINEIMVDEYQDTNDINEYFISLLSNNNIYMVGDVKQSIYGFRNANPYLFMKKYQDYAKEKEGIKIDLTENFRSKKEVLDAINMIFEKIMDEEIGGANYKEGHQMKSGLVHPKQNGEISHTLEILNYDYEKGPYRKEEMEAFLIAYDIKRKVEKKYTIFDRKEGKQRPLSYHDFTILMDRKTDFDLYKQIFTYLNIPVTIDKNQNFIVSDEIYVIKNILKILYLLKEKMYYDESFAHAFMSVARSFLFSYTDEEIFQVFLKAKNDNKTIYKVLKESSSFQEMMIKFENIVSILPSLRLSDLLFEIYKTFDFYRKMNRKGEVYLLSNKLDYLMDFSRKLEEMGYGIEEFILYIEDALEYKNDTSFSIKDTENKGVTITNIHKSKGLEYSVCYYSGLFKSFSKEDFKEKFLFSKDYGFIVPVFKEGIKETILKDLFKEEYLKKDKAEKIRLFYVALTRAREKMVFVTSLEDSDEKMNLENGKISTEIRMQYGSFYDILKSLKKVCSPFLSNIKIDKIGLTKKYQIGKNEFSFQKIEKMNTKLSFFTCNIEKEKKKEERYSTPIVLLDKEKKRKMELGKQLHEYLELVDFKKLEEDIKKYEIPNFYKEILRDFMSMPFMENLHKKTLYKEYMFIDPSKNQKGIIDLLIEEEDKYIIVDYKLKEIEKDSYQNQVRGYMEYIKKAKNKKVEGYIYSLLDKTFIEVKIGGKNPLVLL